MNCSVYSFFGFPSHESRNWSLKLIDERAFFIAKLISNVSLDFMNLVPLFGFDGSSSVDQMLNNDSIVISKGNLCTLLLVVSFILRIVALIWFSLNSLFKLILKIKLELRYFTNWVTLIIVCLLPSLICLFFDVELDGIVSSSDSLNIPVNIVVSLDSRNIIEVYDSEQVHKD